MSLIVALGDEGEASGQLFWDDGESIGQLLSHSCCFCELFLNQLFCTSYWKMLTCCRGESSLAKHVIINH